MRDALLRARVASWMLAFASMTHGRSLDQRRGVRDVILANARIQGATTSGRRTRNRRDGRAPAHHHGCVVSWILAFARMTRVCQSRPYLAQDRRGRNAPMVAVERGRAASPNLTYRQTTLPSFQQIAAARDEEGAKTFATEFCREVR